jgi:hypothetical protein
VELWQMYFISPFFCSSFNDKPVNDAVSGPIGKELFEKEQEDLPSDLKDIPKAACDRRVGLFIYLFLLKSHFILFSTNNS